MPFRPGANHPGACLKKVGPPLLSPGKGPRRTRRQKSLERPFSGKVSPVNCKILDLMSEIEIEQMQEKIDAGILLAQQRLKERVKKEDGELVIMRDGKITHVKAEDL